jgi:hypothetical protein
VKVAVLWDVAPCSLVESDWRFGGDYCPYHEGVEEVISNRLHGATSQKTATFIFVALRIWNLTILNKMSRKEKWRRSRRLVPRHGDKRPLSVIKLMVCAMMSDEKILRFLSGTEAHYWTPRSQSANFAFDFNMKFNNNLIWKRCLATQATKLIEMSLHY